MSKITRANIAAAKAQRDILMRRKQEVPERIRKLAELDPERLPHERTGFRAHPQAVSREGSVPSATDPLPAARTASEAAGSWVVSVLQDQLWANTPGGAFKFPRSGASALSKLSDFSALSPTLSQLSAWTAFRRTCVVCDPPNIPTAIWMVDDSNVGRAEHYIHEEGELGATTQRRPPAG